MESKSKYITIGIAGHVDHGKTSIVKSLPNRFEFLSAIITQL